MKLLFFAFVGFVLLISSNSSLAQQTEQTKSPKQKGGWSLNSTAQTSQDSAVTESQAAVADRADSEDDKTTAELALEEELLVDEATPVLSAEANSQTDVANEDVARDYEATELVEEGIVADGYESDEYSSNLLVANDDPVEVGQDQRVEAESEAIESDIEPMTVDQDSRGSGQEAVLTHSEPTAQEGDDLEAPLASEQSLEPKRLSNELDVQTVPRIDMDSAERLKLETLFTQIQELKDTEDAFSERLGESYSAYAGALQEAGRLEEARKMYANALHITKINNGVNAIEQRPLLRSVATMDFAEGNLEDAENTIKRIIFLEKQNAEQRDEYSFDLVVRLGNEFLNRYLYRPVISETSLQYLTSASKYFGYAIDRYGDKRLEDLFMPYGELAYVHYLKSKVMVEVDRSHYQNSRQRSFNDLDRFKTTYEISNSYTGSERYLRMYLAKAQEEGSTIHIVSALLNLGDVSLVHDRRNTAAQYYSLAWEEAQKLPADHYLVRSMQAPVKLPAFNYAQDRNDRIPRHQPVVYFPISFAVSQYGRVQKIHTDPQTTENPKLAQRARRLVKRLNFRPIIENGEMVSADMHTHLVRIGVRRSEAQKTAAFNSNSGE